MKHVAAVLVLALVALAAESPAASNDSPESAAALAAKLRKTGRAQARFERRFHDFLRGEDVVMHGTLVLEPPDRARIAFDETGEIVTLRADGGEWLQPRLQQLVRFAPERAWAALRWWRLFGGAGGESVRERRRADGAYVVVIADRDSAVVRIGDDGLPVEVEVRETGGEPATYAGLRWRFSKPRGTREFRLEAPPTYDVFDLP